MRSRSLIASGVASSTASQARAGFCGSPGDGTNGSDAGLQPAVARSAATTAAVRFCIETDVRATRDGVAVAFHDERLDRVTDEAGPIARCTWAELACIRVGGAEPIPRREDVLAAWPDMRLIIDPKSDDAVPPLIEAVRRNGTRERVCIGSFSVRRLRRVRTDAPGCTSCARAEVLRLRAASYGVPVGNIVADCAQVPLRYSLAGSLSIPVVDEAFVRTAHDRGMPVQVWTVNDEAEMERLRDFGVDGIMTDRVSMLKEVFGRRGLWH